MEVNSASAYSPAYSIKKTLFEQVIYRIFSVILKNLHKENIDFNNLHDFLNELVQRPFFKAHEDYNYDKILNLMSSMATYETDEYKG